MKFIKHPDSIWLFYLEGDHTHLYRAIPKRNEKYLPLIRKFKETIKFKKTNHKITVGNNKDCLVLKIPKLPFQIRIQETTRYQAKRMISHLISLIIQSFEIGIIPYDIHQSNILYWKDPIFVDLDAFRETNSYDYMGTFVRIAYLFNRYVRRLPITDPHQKYGINRIEQDKGWISKLTKGKFHTLAFWKNFKQRVEDHDIEIIKSHWSSEYAKNYRNEKAILQKNKKISAAVDILKELGGTLIDVGCNKGYLSSILSEYYDNIIGFDFDENCINIATEHNKNDEKLEFVFMDIDYFKNRPKIQWRYRADVLSALAVTHHFKDAGYEVPFICKMFNRLAKKSIVLEQIVHKNAYENELKARGFELVFTVDSYPAGRSISLFNRVDQNRYCPQTGFPQQA